MNRIEAWLFHLSNALVSATGLAYAWAAYVAESDDPFSVVNHPLQPALQHLHLLAAPFVVFAAGVIWQSHVWARLRSGSRPRRWSGFSLIAALVPMVASGYLIQIAVDDAWRRAFVAVHLAASALWILGYGVHALGLVFAARRRASAPALPPAQVFEPSSSTRG